MEIFGTFTDAQFERRCILRSVNLTLMRSLVVAWRPRHAKKTGLGELCMRTSVQKKKVSGLVGLSVHGYNLR
jgi:hypothetical protein